MTMSRSKALALLTTPQGRDTVAYGYSRVSHASGFKKGDSCESQAVRINHYYETMLREKGVQWGEVDNDGENISAYKVKFQNRPAGRRLLAIMKPGDHLIVDKVDRFWRSLEDFVTMMKLFEAKKIVVHIVNFLGATIQSDTPMGDYMLKHFVLVAELESSIKSERTKEAILVVRQKGARSNNSIPKGCKLVTAVDAEGRTVMRPNGKPQYMLQWCPKQRLIMREICRLINVEQMRWSAAYPLIEAFAAKVEGRKIRPQAERTNDEWHAWSRMRAYEDAYNYLNIRDVSQIPRLAIILQAAKQARRKRTNDRTVTDTHSRAYAKEAFCKSIIQPITPDQLLGIVNNY